MKITKHGYQTREQKVYPMSMGELKLSIIQTIVENELQDIKIRIVSSTLGEVDEYKNLNDFILTDFNNGYEINVIGAKITHFNTTNEDIMIIHIEEI